MQRNIRWMIVVLIIAALQLSACAGAAPKPETIKPAVVEPIEGSDLKRVTLTQKAAERLGIQTVTVREDQVARTRTVGGEVVASRDTEAALWVRVRLNESDLNGVDQGQLAHVRTLDDEDGEEDSEEAEADEGPELDDGEDGDTGERSLYYKLSTTQQSLALGERVWVELTLSGSGTQQTVVPYAAVIYDVNGKTWVYTNPEPLVFIRQSINVDYIAGDLAFLKEGPPAGTAVVTVGGSLLYGTEVGVSK